MKPASDALKAFLASADARAMVFADIITFYLVGGTDENYRLRYTTAQQDVSEYPIDGDVMKRTWTARDMLITGLRAKQSIGTNVDEQDLTLTPSPDCLILGDPARQAILYGALDGAFVRRDRFYYADWGEPSIGAAPKFFGMVGPFTALGRMDATVKVKSGMGLLSIQMPRHLAQPSCLNTVYDAGCGLDAAAHAVHTTIGAGATQTVVPLVAPSTDYTLGRVLFEDEGVAGLWRGIKASDGTGITLYEPLPTAPLATTHVTIYPGCDRTKAGGCTRLANTARFRGFPMVPDPHAAI